MAGFGAEIYDTTTRKHGYPQIEQHFRQSGASYIASTAITSSINDAVKTLECAKRVNPRVVTILGGVHPTFCFEEVLNATSAVDYIICGEGEQTLVELLRTLESGGTPDTVAGLAFRRDGAIVRTAPRAFAGSLDDLPAAWDLLDWQEYTYFVIPDSRLAATSTPEPAVALAWTDNAYGETGWVVERSADGAAFAVVKTLGAGATFVARTIDVHRDRALVMEERFDRPALGEPWKTAPSGSFRSLAAMLCSSCRYPRNHIAADI